MFDIESVRYNPTIEHVINPCMIDGCGRESYTTKLCNAHYIRTRKGLDLTTPIKHRSSDTKCGICGDLVGGKGGWGLCKAHYKNRRRWVLKRAIIEYFGSCCSECKGVFHPAAFDFHHIDGGEKDDAISSMFESASIDRIESELSKCKLMCSNCHRVEHHGHN